MQGRKGKGEKEAEGVEEREGTGAGIREERGSTRNYVKERKKRKERDGQR